MRTHLERDAGRSEPVAGAGQIAADFRDYAALIADARAAVRQNAAELADVVASVVRQDDLVRDTAAAVTAVSGEASHMATTVELLQRHVGSAAQAGVEAGAALDDVAAALAQLQRGLSASSAPLAEIGRSVRGLGEMLGSLGKLAGQAQLLAVNAAIEAAHINGTSSRFDIVASEVRALATSTRDAAAEVKGIATNVRGAADSVTRAAAASIDAVSSTDRDVRSSVATLGGANRSIDELGQAVTAIGSASSEQSAALQTVAASVDEIASHASGARRATGDAGALELERLLAPAEARLRRWTGDAAVAADEDAVRAADADQRAIVGDLITLAVAVAYNGVAWRSIGTSVSALRAEIEQVRRTVGESTHAARSASAASASMRTLVASLKERYDEAMASLDRGLTAIADVERAVADADRRVAAMTDAVQRTHEIVELIDSVSDDTVLLSLNAAIESSRAGTSGAGFSIIADEIRRLAGSTQDVTSSVSAFVAQIAARSDDVRTTIAAVAEHATAVTAAAERARTIVTMLRSALEETLRCALAVSDAADGQVRGLERVLENATRSAQTLDGYGTGQAHERRLELYALGNRAHHIAARRDVARETAAVRRFVLDVATRVEAVFDEVVLSGRAPADAFFDFRYEEIRGERISELGRLFDVSRVPREGFAPPKYATSWDALIDERVVAVLEEAFEQAAFARPIVFSATDLNGFAYAYPRRLVAGWTGIDERDRSANRIKRLLEDDHALRMIRTGIGPGADGIGTRAPYAAFTGAGCALDRRPGERPWELSIFARDIDDVVNDLNVPIYVRGRRHGAIRFGYHVEVL